MDFLDLTLPTIEENLALDEALLVAVEEGRRSPLVRLWELEDWAVVLGASGRVQDDVNVGLCETDGIRIARRSSGGGTVLIGPGALNFTVILPRDFAPGLEAVDVAQHFVLDRVASALRERSPGVPVEVLGSGDLTVGSRKVAGSAQRRLKYHFLVHASILYDFPLERIALYLRPPLRQPAYRQNRPHADFVANLGLPRGEIMEAIGHSWSPIQVVEGISPDDRAVLDDLIRTKFADPAWIFRF